MTSRSFPILMLLFFAGCGHASGDAPLKSRLTLESGFSVLQLNAPSEAVFVIRNTSSTSIEFCLVDGGVSLVLRLPDGVARPLVVYTAVTDARCHKRQRLAPGEGATLREVLDLSTSDLGLTGSSVDVVACIRVGWPDRDTKADDGHLCSGEFKLVLHRQRD